ncbi:hypothetical protein [Caminibacter pacificus]|uniref:Uncharacterized protein n=1 Tax=Caminibacter pacificus TaxID=1424653 RepID=A0AAJ4RCF8_9BACT|nr:hypothetical protein [Caminibacter pacificus]ROR39533.1 hypothetical protein EDC58_1473 [Caminibacter pacificus]
MKNFFIFLFKIALVLFFINVLLFIFNNNYKNFISGSVVALYFNYKNKTDKYLQMIKEEYHIKLNFPKNKWIYYFNNLDKNFFKVEIVSIKPKNFKNIHKKFHINIEITLSKKFNSMQYLKFKQKQCKDFFVKKDINIENNKYKLFFCKTKKRIFPVNIISENKTNFIINYWPFVKNDEMSIKQVKRFLKYIKFI